MTEPPFNHPVPTGEQERIRLLDGLRGLALLGVLLVNMNSFGLASGAAREWSLIQGRGLNFYCWYIFGHGVFEGAFRALFSMLFGAGMLIFVGRLGQRMAGILPAEYFVRRQLWLLLFGLVNSFIFLWDGDILYHYALCGLFLPAFYSRSPRQLLAASLVTLLLLVARENKDFFEKKQIIRAGEAAAAVDTSQRARTAAEQADLAEWESLRRKYSAETLNREAEKQTSVFRSGYREMFAYQSGKVVSAQTYGLYYFHFFDVLTFMFLGMAFFKSGILQGRASRQWYGWMAVLGLGIGLPLSYLHLQPLMESAFDKYAAIRQKPFELYELQRFVRALGIFGLIMWLYRAGLLVRLLRWLEPMGRMAFTHYLAQSVICGFIFYGWGLGRYGYLRHWQLYGVAAVILLLQVLFSHVWLRYFRFGPLEWCWRALTYWKKPALLRSRQEAA